jgi:hypothetical protein
MDYENIISTDLLEMLFNSMNDDNFNNLVKCMYNFLKENEFKNNIIHFALLNFFYERNHIILSKYNLNFSQIKIILNELIINQNEIPDNWWPQIITTLAGKH